MLVCREYTTRRDEYAEEKAILRTRKESIIARASLSYCIKVRAGYLTLNNDILSLTASNNEKGNSVFLRLGVNVEVQT